MNVLTSNKGGNKLFHNGYSYHLDSAKTNLFKWRCAERKKFFCKSKLVTTMEDNQHKEVQSFEHCHDPRAADLSATKANVELKYKAASTTQPPSQIIREVTVQCEPLSRIYLPNKQAQYRKIKRIRSSVLKEPTSLSEIYIPQHLRYLEEELFILSEKDIQNDKIIILGTVSSIKILSESSCWLMDGTFYVVPTIMAQLFSIHGKIGNQIIPLLFCLMSKKNKKCYTEFFFELHRIAADHNIPLKPKRIISDFEKTIHSAAREFFPSTDFKGCLFHFGQIIWRQVQKSKVAVKYGRSEAFSLEIRMIKSLAFVPPTEIKTYYKELYKHLEDNDSKKIAKWLKTNYIAGINNTSPKYDPEFWSIEDAWKQNFPSTQNSVEAWHRRLKVVVGKRNSGLYTIIDDLKKELILAKTNYQKINSGEHFPQNKKNVKKYKQIKKVIKKRLTIPKIDYLKNIAYNIHLMN